ncbi:MAG: hypothetical protein R3C19_04390 [Planctomycetaceae bacterium]
MPIVAECYDCGKQYRFGDERAGSRLPCKACGGTIDVPGKKRSRQPSTTRALPPAMGSGSRTRTRSTSSRTPIIIAAVAAGILVGGGGLAMMAVTLFNDADTSNSVAANPAGDAGSSDANTITPADLTDKEKAEREALYQENLARQRLANSKVERESLARQYGEDKVVTVVFTDVVGDSLAANKYLNRKVFRAAYKDYQAGQERADQQTEQNKKAAEQQALAQHQQNWGGFGPTLVTYRYQRVRSDVPYPSIVTVGRVGNTYTFHAAPALNPREFAERLGVGNVSNVQGREVRIQALLPTPIPDPDVEELALEYGLSNVYKISVQAASGEPDRVQLYLENETTPLGLDGKRLSIAGMKALGSGAYEFSAGPIPDPQVFGERITWGSVQSISAGDRIISVQASLPENLPSKEELDAVKKKQKELDDAIRKADWEHRPRPNESELDWAVRVITNNDSFAAEKAYKALAIMEVDESRREEISELLLSAARTGARGLEHYIPAMVVWKTDETEKVILSISNDRHFHREAEALMKALADLKTEQSAKMLASAVADFHNGDKSVQYLNEMGPFAEDAVLDYIEHRDERTRERVYNVLAVIGGRRSLSAVNKNLRQETNARMKAIAAECSEVIRKRMKEEESGETEEAGDSAE